MAIDSQSPNAKKAGFTQTRSAAQATETIFDKYQLASFTLANGLKVAFPVQKIRQDGANRVIERERPYRAGAKLDDTGPKAITWTFECIFHNSINEPGLAAFNNQVNLYPDALNDLISIFDEGQTGDLVVPTIGRVRAKALDYQRVEDVSLFDGATMMLVFKEDNEDNVDARSITAPTINAQGQRMAGKTTFDAESVAISGNGMASVRTAASQLQTAINAPGDSLDDVRAQATTVRNSVKQVMGAFKDNSQPGRGKLNDPTSTDVQRALADIADTAARAANQPRRGRPIVITVVSVQPTTLQRVAVAFGQSYSDLLSINAQLSNPLYIAPNTYIKIFSNDAVT